MQRRGCCLILVFKCLCPISPKPLEAEMFVESILRTLLKPFFVEMNTVLQATSSHLKLTPDSFNFKFLCCSFVLVIYFYSDYSTVYCSVWGFKVGTGKKENIIMKHLLHLQSNNYRKYCFTHGERCRKLELFSLYTFAAVLQIITNCRWIINLL